MSIKLRTLPLFRAILAAGQAAQTAVMTATNVFNTVFSGQLVTSQLPQTMNAQLQTSIGPFPLNNVQFTQGIAADFDLMTQLPIPANESFTSLTLFSGSLNTGTTGITLVSNLTEAHLHYNGTGTGSFANVVVSLLTTLTSALVSEFQARITNPGLVWYHNFESDAEVKQFQWTGGFGGGNDPTGAGDVAITGFPNVVRVPTGGPDGGGYLQITHPVGVAPNRIEVGQWWRPFSPMTGASNGKGVSDAAAMGSLTPQVFTPSPQGSQTNTWAAGSKPGWYGPTPDSRFDGTDFWFQLRVMMDPRRTTPGNGNSFGPTNAPGGKLAWFNVTASSNPNQELVTYQCYTQHNQLTAAGQPNYHMMYSRNGQLTFEGIGGGTAIQVGHDWTGLICDAYNGVVGGCWNYATDGTWDTLLYHVTPGVAGSASTHLEVWAAHANQTSYVKLWDVMYDAAYSVDGSANFLPGWNALLLSAYNNGYIGSGGYDTGTQFWTRYAQLLFSKSFIACPNVPTINVNAASSPGGNGTAAAPFQTIQAGINAAVAGQTVLVQPGSYPELATVNKAITLRAAGSGGGNFPVTILGQQTRTNGILITSSGVVVDGFKVTFAVGVGIYVLGPNVSVVEIKNCWTRETGSSGIAAWGTAFNTDPAASNWRGIQNLFIHDNIVERANNAFWGAGGFNEHITIANGVYNFRIYRNVVGNSLNSFGDYSAANGGEGIDLKEAVENGWVYNNTVYNLQRNGIYVDAGRSNVNNGYTLPGFARNIHVFNNLVYGIQAHGITVTAEARIADSATAANGRKGGAIQDIFIDYNTVYGCVAAGILAYDFGLLSNGFTPSNVPLADNVQIVNNITHGNNTGGTGAYSGHVIDHHWMTNLLVKKPVTTGNFAGIHTISGTPTIVTPINSDPLFVNGPGADFHLQAGSPADNAGGDALITPTTDFYGTTRVVPTAIGAVER
jgi:hypothetical protein